MDGANLPARKDNGLTVSRLALHTALLATVALATQPSRTTAHGAPPEIADVIYAAAAEYGVSGDELFRVIHCESAHFRPDVMYGPTRGAAGEIGAAQLHPAGLLRTFFSVGFDDPWDPSQSIYFAAWGFAHGLRGHWNC